MAWDRVNPAYGPFEGRLTVLQGEDDTVVDRRYNVEYLAKRFPSGMEDVEVEGGHHYVFVWVGKPWLSVEAALDRILGQPRAADGTEVP